MKPDRINTPLPRPQHGLSLVELMVAITLSLLLLAGVIQIYLGSKVTYRLQEGLSRVQENGRFAMAFMTKDIRMTGYMGCAKLGVEGGVTPSIIVRDPPEDVSFDLEDPIEVVVDDAGSGATYGTRTLVEGSDVIKIRGASPTAPTLTGNLSADNANIQIESNPDNIEADDILFITDCETADIFVSTGVSESSGKTTVAHANSTNTTNRLSKAYQQDAMLMRFNSQSYFVADTLRDNDTGSDIFALYRRNDITGTNEELIEGVQDMQVMYGVDNDGDGTADEYVSEPSGGAETVVSIRVALLVNSVENASSETPTYTDLSGTAVVAADRMLRRTFQSTIGLRNRLP